MATSSDSTNPTSPQSQNPSSDNSAVDNAIKRAHIQGTIDGVNMALSTLEESIPLSLKSIREALTEELLKRLAALDEHAGAAS